MTDCHIRAANASGAHLLRLEGDVRLTMCTALDEYFEQIFKDPDFASVSVDVTGATGLDSTTLGMLAKLAINTREQFGFRPNIYSCSPGIDRLLNSMGFSQLFEMRHQDCSDCGVCADVPEMVSSEAEVKQRVIEAHRTLMNLNKTNRDAFKDLVQTLENS